MDAGTAKPMELSINLQGGDINVALILGVTGLVGKEIAAILKRRGWKVYGVARRNLPSPDCIFIPCDLLDRKETMDKLSQLQDVTHIFWVTWCSEFSADSQEGCAQNESMIANALDAVLGAAKSPKHFSLQTGTAHYLSVGGHDVRSDGDHSDEDGETSKVTAIISKRATTVDGVEYSYYYDEESPKPANRMNFYYTLEEVARKRLSGKVGWSVHRPGLLMGNSLRTEVNVMGSLCVYGSVCKHLSLPFLFGGSRQCWEEACLDASDARMVAKQQIWAATAGPKLQQREDPDRGSEEGALVLMDGEAFNVVNGSPFTWKEVWPALAAKFGLAAPAGRGDDPFFSEEFSYVKAMGDKGVVWEEIVQKNGLLRTRMEELANWGFLDSLFRMPFKLLVSREKSDRLGFTSTCNTLSSILYWVDCIRDDKVVP
ncbi:3-oxo-Delta-4-5-steroid 5-beta-reductase [Nymphaea thermarum]|nr:3-oxo-Delta-4-5-steroid 5-beta-reductase [Nymphaea thermarum]